MSTTAHDTDAVDRSDSGHGEIAHEHPSDFTYFKVFIFLLVVTAVEVGLYYVDMSATALLIALLPLMTVKFAVVAGWFMHLRFDSRIFRRFFVTGIVLAVGVYLIVLSTFQLFA